MKKESDFSKKFLSVEDEIRQASWYCSYRKEIYRKIGLRHLKNILDAGCSAGAITEELGKWGSEVIGVDLRKGAIEIAKARTPSSKFLVCNIEDMPFCAESFDAITTAFTIMWLKNPEKFFKESYRILRKGGYLVIFAEPDYEGLIEFPPDSACRKVYVKAIKKQGGDSSSGRKLCKYIFQAGLKVIQMGVIDSVWTPERWKVEEEKEFFLLLKFISPDEGESINQLRKEREKSIERGEIFFFLPIFYAVAIKDK